ncbi:hypothetical protein PGTUg99_034062 [Puccinia graminis f. sp. tritici]|uniref:Uncharacterized protein n=1 Tax=Puccinia graminis f. sp. tritici TaxID=56615 RepID=A0A5B0PMN8_PUCGR|nr:hypothetical protein PGTUg99_034062 [Puccinia graminis f. sp. tritici]
MSPNHENHIGPSVSEPSSKTSNNCPLEQSHPNTVTIDSQARAGKEKEQTVLPSIQHRISNPLEPELLARINNQSNPQTKPEATIQM